MMMNPRNHCRARHGLRQSDSGQLVIEYALLLVVAVMLAVIITRQMVSRGENPGFVIATWQAIITTIGADLPDDIPRQ